MAYRTVTLDVEAYEILKSQKQPGQSFSDVVKERFPRRATARDLLAALRSVKFDSDVAESIAKVVAARDRSPATAPRLD